MAVVAASSFEATVTSKGQHDIPCWFGADFPLVGFSGDLPPEWQQSMFAIGPEWCWFARTGRAQPIKQAKTATHKEMNVDIHTLNVCRVGRITSSLLHG